jgi:Ca-activated chloride channel homolog
VSLIEQLALEGRGTAQFVRPDESVERAVSVVASRLVDPVMTGVRVRGEGVRLSRIHPEQPFDLFAGQDLVIFARYNGRGRARVIFEGQSRRGLVHWETPVTFVDRERGNSFVARLWATQRVGYLSAERRKMGASQEIDSEIRELGERYGIPTQFTSYFVKEPGMVADGAAGGRRAIALRGRSERSFPANAPAPVYSTRADTVSVSAAHGTDQFEQARKAAEQRGATSLGAPSVQLNEVVVTAAGAVQARNVGGRAFLLQDGRWTDTRYATSARVTKVKAYSKAYFALMDEAPELREMFALGERVLVAGKSAALEIDAAGEEELNGPEMQRLLRDLGLKN